MLERGMNASMTALLRILGLALIAAVLLNFANVIGRYIFGTSILWADEVEMVILVLITFLGAVVVGWRREHLSMDLLLNNAPAPVRATVRLFELFCLIAVAGLVCWNSYSYAMQMLALGRTSDNAEIPMWLPHGAVAVGFGLIVLVAIWHVVADMRR